MVESSEVESWLEVGKGGSWLVKSLVGNGWKSGDEELLGLLSILFKSN